MPHRDSDGYRLLQSIYHYPASDDHRLVYSDYLQEREDPRGEFIALQYQRHRAGGDVSERELALLGRYRELWLGRVSLAVSDVRFERGFVHWARVTTLKAGLDAPEWSTLVSLECGEGLVSGWPDSLTSFIRYLSTFALREVSGVDQAMVEALRQGVPETHLDRVVLQTGEIQKLPSTSVPG